MARNHMVVQKENFIQIDILIKGYEILGNDINVCIEHKGSFIFNAKIVSNDCYKKFTISRAYVATL